MKFVDLVKENDFHRNKILARLTDVYDSGCFLFGAQLEEFEARFAEYIGTEHCVGVANCTDALTLAIKTVYRKNMPIVLCNFGAMPTAVAARAFTDNLYYVDCDNSFTMDPEKLPNVKGGIVIVVHLFGNNANMVKIKEYCDANNHVLIEDCAQSAGSGSGAIGDMSCFSFYPTKPLSSNGDGGCVCTNSNYYARTIKKLRFYGVKQTENPLSMIPGGINSRLGEVQAATLNVKLPFLNHNNAVRANLAERYNKIFTNGRWNAHCVFHQYVILVEQKEKVVEVFKEDKIPFAFHYPFHLSDILAVKGRNHDPVNYRINDKVISIPVHPYLTEEEIQQVEESLQKVKKYECE